MSIKIEVIEHSKPDLPVCKMNCDEQLAPWLENYELTKFFKEIIRSDFEIPYFPKYSEIEKYSRFSQAAMLSKIIDELVQL